MNISPAQLLMGKKCMWLITWGGKEGGTFWRQMRKLCYFEFEVRSTSHREIEFQLPYDVYHSSCCRFFWLELMLIQDSAKTINVWFSGGLCFHYSLNINNHSICVHDIRTCRMMYHEQEERQASKKRWMIETGLEWTENRMRMFAFDFPLNSISSHTWCFWLPTSQ